MSDQPVILVTRTQPLEPSQRNWPVATLIFLALNLAVFLLVTFSGGTENADVLLRFGASYGPYIRRGEYWRLVMPMFLHSGWLHLLVNGYALYILGAILERVYGYGRYALLYVASGIGGSVLSMELSNDVAVGASGAIFGIAGVMLVTGYLHPAAVPRRWGRAFGKGMLPFIVLNLAFGLTVPHIDNWGHVGGLASGVLLALVIPPPGHDTVPGAIPEEPSQAVVLVPALIVGLAMAATYRSYQISQAVTQLLREGERLRGEQHADLALLRFQEAARRAPLDERPHEEIGALYLEQKRVPEAIQEYEEALRLAPGSTQAQLGLALAYRQKGDLAKARQLIESALGKNPSTAEGQEALADLCFEQKLYPEAIDHYQQALGMKPDMAEAHNNLAWLFATAEDARYRKPQEALQHARQAVELSHWKQAEFIDTLAEALYANGKYAEAVKVQEKALELDPANRDLQDHMARYRKAAGG